MDYITKVGYQSLQAELQLLVSRTRPDVVAVVQWAAANGDRSENGDYLYGKKRLREIDRRIRYLTKKLELLQVVDPSDHEHNHMVYFGSKVTVKHLSGPEAGEKKSYQIVGEDEANPSEKKISWRCPLAKALLRAQAGDIRFYDCPNGRHEVEIEAVLYD